MYQDRRDDRTIYVMLVEDHREYRETVELAMNTTPDIRMVGTFSAAEIALWNLEHDVSPQKPDVILLDLNLPGVNGLEALPSFLSIVPAVKVIVLTQSNQQADITQAISKGASGYLLKSSTLTQIFGGIRDVMQVSSTLDPSVAKFLLGAMKNVSSTNEREPLLTARELEVVQMLAEGLTKKQIASQLGISTSTVSHHAVHIFEKLNVQNAPAAIAKAFRLRLLSAE